MFTDFITFLGPPGSTVAGYDRTKPHTSQPDTVPEGFLEAMSIREEVFVKEQEIPIEYEFDNDDSRSYHWIVHASVKSSNDPPAPLSQDAPAKRGSTASRLAVGTLRLVPPPHPPHPEPNTTHKIDNNEDAEKVSGTGETEVPGGQSALNPNNEPYVKIGRLAVLKEYRGMGLAKLLLDSALQWARKHPETILPPPSATEREAARMEGGASSTDSKTQALSEKWDGLVMVHAQKHLEAMYTKLGFETDKGLGEWFEDGVLHVGMWSRLKVKKQH